jgi:hypothetical protein
MDFELELVDVTNCEIVKLCFQAYAQISLVEVTLVINQECSNEGFTRMN